MYFACISAIFFHQRPNCTDCTLYWMKNYFQLRVFFLLARLFFSRLFCFLRLTIGVAGVFFIRDTHTYAWFRARRLACRREASRVVELLRYVCLETQCSMCWCVCFAEGLKIDPVIIYRVAIRIFRLTANCTMQLATAISVHFLQHRRRLHKRRQLC